MVNAVQNWVSFTDDDVLLRLQGEVPSYEDGAIQVRDVATLMGVSGRTAARCLNAWGDLGIMTRIRTHPSAHYPRRRIVEIMQALAVEE